MKENAPAKKGLRETIAEMNAMIADKMSKIRFKIPVMSGKGGVGKSFITVNVAVGLASKGKRVAIFDADFHGPSVAKMLNLVDEIPAISSKGIIPVEGPMGVKVISLDMLLEEKDAPTIWRGPLKTNVIRQLLAEVEWGELDYLLIDLPPGTGDEPLSIAQLIPSLTGIIMVTIPSGVSEHVVKKAIVFAEKLKVPIIGIVENMSYFECPNCGEVYYLLGKGAGERLTKKYGLRLLGKIPLDPYASLSCDEGTPIVLKENCDTSRIILEVVDKLINVVEQAGSDRRV